MSRLEIFGMTLVP